MKLSCEIVQDLMEMYEAGLCSPESRAAVEVHLRECAACREKFEAMQNIVREEEPVFISPQDESVIRSFGKIRRRWIRSVIATLLVVPVLILSINQYRQAGVCFANLDDILLAYGYARALEKGDFEKAAGYMDYDRIYDDIQNALAWKVEDNQLKCTAVELNGETWMASQTIAEEYAGCEGDETRFWRQMICNRRFPVMIPEDIWNGFVTMDSKNGEYADENAAVLNGGEYEKYQTPWGNYMAAAGHDLSKYASAADYCFGLDLIPEAIWLEAKEELDAEARRQYAFNQKYYAGARDMSADEFASFMKAHYASELRATVDQGVTFKCTGYKESYYIKENDCWVVEYGMQAITGRETYRFSIDVGVCDGEISIGSISHSMQDKWLDDLTETIFLSWPGEE